MDAFPEVLATSNQNFQGVFKEDEPPTIALQDAGHNHDGELKPVSALFNENYQLLTDK